MGALPRDQVSEHFAVVPPRDLRSAQPPGWGVTAGPLSLLHRPRAARGWGPGAQAWLGVRRSGQHPGPPDASLRPWASLFAFLFFFFFFNAMPVNISKNTIWETAHRSHAGIPSSSGCGGLTSLTLPPAPPPRAARSLLTGSPCLGLLA